MSFLDAFMPKLVDTTINLVSATATYRRVPAPTYDPLSGADILKVPLEYSVKISPPQQVKRDEFPDNSTLKQQFECYISRTTITGQALEEPNVATDFIIIGSTVFRIAAVEPSYCGNSITHYRLILEA